VISKDGSYAEKSVLNYMVEQSQFEKQNMNYSISLFNVEYLTKDDKGNQIASSGALILPWITGGDFSTDKKTGPVLSFQHGTLLKKADAPSASWGPELAYASLFASTGFITLVPDLPGMGTASINKSDIHPYCQAKPIAYACADLIRGMTPALIDRFNNNWVLDNDFHGFYKSDNKLYLTGYSEGGYATMALLKELNENKADYSGNWKIKAVAGQSGPYSLSDVMCKKLMSDEAFPVFYFAPYLIVTLNKYSNLGYQPQDFLAPGFLGLYDLIDGNHSDAQVDALKPSSGKPKDMFETGARYQMENNQGPFYNKLKENDLDTSWTWDASTDVRLFHSTDDDCVPYQNTLNMIRAHPDIKLSSIYEDFSFTKWKTGKTKHELYYIYSMGYAWSWLNKELSEDRK
jgi:hypothetical protein